MSEQEPLNYYIDYSHRFNCSCLLSAKPGKEIAVLVRDASNREAPPIKARGYRSPDGLSFKVTTASGEQICELAYKDVEQLAQHKD